MNADIASTIEALLKPIAPENPGGVDSKYDPRNEQIRKEIAKLEGIHQQSVDWQLVADQSTVLLSQVSKDLGLSCQLALSWYHLRGIEGLTDGLRCLEGILQGFWINCFPSASRIRGRINLINWLEDRLIPLLSECVIAEKDRDAFEGLKQTFNSLQSTIREQFTEEAPSLSELERTFQRWEISLASPSPAENESPPTHSSSDHREESQVMVKAEKNTDNHPIANDFTTEGRESEHDLGDTADQTVDKLILEAAPWLDPISSDHPGGKDARYTPEHETIRAEITKTQTIQASPVNWSEVYDKADLVLRNQAKDLTIAAYFCIAMLTKNGIIGLSLGLITISEIIDRYWEDLFPEKRRMRGRVAALTWLIEQIEPRIEQIELKPPDRYAIIVLEQSGKRFAEIVRERFADECPPLRTLSDTISRLQLSIPSEANPKTEPNKTSPSVSEFPNLTSNVEPKSAQDVRSTAKIAAPAVAIASEDLEEISGFLFATGENLCAVAGNLRRANPHNPLAYRLIRAGLWLHLERPPPSDASGKTEIAPWPDERRKQLQALMGNQKWTDVLDESESDLRQHRFCLDLHRFTAQALRHLGEKTAEAHELVLVEVAALIGRMPSLLQLNFQDNSPFADAETRKWIDDEVYKSGQEGHFSSTEEDPNEALAEKIADLEKALSSSSLAEYLPTIETVCQTFPHFRQRFLYRLRAAECCLSHGEARVALLLYSGLVDDAKVHHLDSWEPKLSAASLSGLIMAQRKLSGGNMADVLNSQSIKEEAALLSQLGQIDLQMAIRLMPTS